MGQARDPFEPRSIAGAFLVLTGAASLFLPERLLYLVENIRARQAHVCQISFIETFQFVSGPDAPPPHREQFLRFIPKLQATQSGYADGEGGHHGSLHGRRNFAPYVAESG